MNGRANPFEELYVSETIPPSQFVSLFSPFLVDHALPLFQAGNVFITGIQGSGKSMLLSLLKPSIRLAYVDSEEEFPVPPEHRNFISAGINLSKSGILSFGQRPIDSDPVVSRRQFPFYFADFLNFWIVDDLLQSCGLFSQRAGGYVAEELGLRATADRWDNFSDALVADPCWFGALEKTRGLEALRHGLRSRLSEYFNYLNYNSNHLPDAIRFAKTTVGVPIARTAFHLRQAGIVPESVKIFVQIDQYEELGRLTQIPEGMGTQYLELINRAIGSRDQTVSYRIGLRRWAWSEHLRMLGTDAVLERSRDYAVVDLDELLRRPENAKWVFPSFADDVVRRRLAVSGYEKGSREMSTLAVLFRERIPAPDRAAMYVHPGRGCTPERIVGLKHSESPQWYDYLRNLAEAAPLEAKFAEAWARQRAGRNLEEGPPKSGRPEAAKLPWDREYWRKERREQALMQLAAGCAQRIVWAGSDHILQLSGGNILVLVSLCRQIWAAYLRWLSDRENIVSVQPLTIPEVAPTVQTVGIEETSRQWYNKIPEQPGGGSRQRFVSLLGRLFRDMLLDDRAMSYPGRNGFSLSVEDLQRYPQLQAFLRDAVAYGDLVETRHTTKEKDRAERMKWYLTPILSPYFQIPATHVKEPYYASVDEVEGWRRQAEALTGAQARPRNDRDNAQPSLFRHE